MHISFSLFILISKCDNADNVTLTHNPNLSFSTCSVLINYADVPSLDVNPGTSLQRVSIYNNSLLTLALALALAVAFALAVAVAVVLPLALALALPLALTLTLRPQAGGLLRAQPSRVGPPPCAAGRGEPHA